MFTAKWAGYILEQAIDFDIHELALLFCIRCGLDVNTEDFFKEMLLLYSKSFALYYVQNKRAVVKFLNHFVD